MSTSNPKNTQPFFSTRDLLTMAVLAALGGVASTYINTLSDAVHAILGIPGATQWAAGLHVLWIVLSMAITGKTGTGTLTGILKGAVELMSGNSHGVIILLVDLVAGLLVDFGFLIFRNQRKLPAYLVAGGLSTASNVIVFQLFATMPLNILAMGAVLVLVGVALVSGFVFAGIIPQLLINALVKAGVVKNVELTQKRLKFGWWIILGVIILSVLLGIYLKTTYKGPEKIQINGAVSQPYAFPDAEFRPDQITKEIPYHGVPTSYQGIPLLDLVNHAQPNENADTLLIKASDGYAFMLSFEEMKSNHDILLIKQGQGQNVSFDIVGPISSKAWVRNVRELVVIAAESLTVFSPDGESSQFEPDAWLESMDSTQIFLPNGPTKLQGVPVWEIALENSANPTSITFKHAEQTLTLDWAEIYHNDNLRIFTVIEDESITYALANMSGEVLVYPLTTIEIQ